MPGALGKQRLIKCPSPPLVRRRLAPFLLHLEVPCRKGPTREQGIMHHQKNLGQRLWIQEYVVFF